MPFVPKKCVPKKLTRLYLKFRTAIWGKIWHLLKIKIDHFHPCFRNWCPCMTLNDPVSYMACYCCFSKVWRHELHFGVWIDNFWLRIDLVWAFPEISGRDWPQKIYVKNWYKVPHFDIQFAFKYIRNKTHSPFNGWVNKICEPRFIGQELVSDTDWKYFQPSHLRLKIVIFTVLRQSVSFCAH